tara:strand:+ start:2091 stop:3341 length:1251 start_codon:yes stop_codon:yes gene_type:complete
MPKWFGYKIEQFGKRFDAAVTMEGGLVLNNILNYAGTDGEYLILNSGSVSYRTVANVKTDIGNATASASGLVELATTIETGTGTDATKAVTPDGLIDGYRGSTNVTTLGTISTGTWNGTAIAHAYIGTDAIETDNIADAQVTVAKLHADAVQTSSESFADNDTSVMTSAAIDDRINTGDAAIASDTLTLTNKTFDANGTGNSLSNVEVADLAAAAIQTSGESFADNDTSLMTSAAIDDRINAAVFTPNYSLVSASGTVTTSTTDGVANAVVIPYDTEQLVSSTNTVILTGSSGLTGISASAYAWYSETQGDWEYQWNVMTNTNIVNNRILVGVKLQRGTHDGSTMTWADYDPSTSFIYDRGNSTVRKGSTTNQTLVTQGGTQYYWRLVVWKEAASNASMNAITVVTGVSLIAKQIS